MKKQFREWDMNRDKPIYMSKDAIYEEEGGKLNENGYFVGTHIRSYRLGTGMIQIKKLMKDPNERIPKNKIDKNGDEIKYLEKNEKGVITSIVFVDKNDFATRYTLTDLYAEGGNTSNSKTKYNFRANNSPLIKYANFVDGSHINLVRLIKPYANGDAYVIGISNLKDGQKTSGFKTLAKAEAKFDILVKEKQQNVGLRNGDRTQNYEQGGNLENNFEAIYNRQKIQLKGTSLWDAKQKAIQRLNVPKSKQGLLSVYSIGSSENQDFRYYAEGGAVRGGLFQVGDNVMVKDSGYMTSFDGFNISEPATIISKSKSKAFGKVVYFYGIETADGQRPYNQAYEKNLTLVEKMAKGGNILSTGFNYEIGGL